MYRSLWERFHNDLTLSVFCLVCQSYIIPLTQTSFKLPSYLAQKRSQLCGVFCGETKFNIEEENRFWLSFSRKKKLYLNHIMDLIKDCGIDMVYMFIIEREKELPCVLFFQLFSILFLPEIWSMKDIWLSHPLSIITPWIVITCTHIHININCYL